MAVRETNLNYQINNMAPQVYLSRLIPYEIAREYELVPLALQDNRLLAASAYPFKRAEIALLQRSIRYPLDIIQTSLPDVRAARRILYQRPDEAPRPLSLERVLSLTGILNESQIFAAQEEQRESGKNPAHFALEKRWISPEQFGEAVALSRGLPHLRGRTVSPSNGMNLFLSFEQAESLGVLPVWWIGNTLYLAINEDHVLDALDDLRELDLKFRAVICDPFTFVQLKKKIYQPHPVQPAMINERRVTERLVEKKMIRADELTLALEIQTRSDISLPIILRDQFGLAAGDWLDAAAELDEVIPLHEKELPNDIEDRVRKFWNVLPENILLQLDLVPLNQEDDTLELGMAVFDKEVLNLAADFSGERAEARLMEPDLIHKLQESALAGKRAGSTALERQVNPIAFDDFLLNTALLQHDQLRELEDNIPDKQDLPSALLEANLLNEVDLAEIYSLISGIPYITLEYFQLDVDLAKLLPADLALERKLLPLFENEGDLWVAVADLQSCDALREAARLSGRRVWPLLVPESALLSALNRFYRFDRSVPQADAIFKFTDELAGAGLISQAIALEVAAAVTEGKQPFDQALIQLGGVPLAELYPRLAALKGVDFLHLGLVETREESFDALGQLKIYQRWQETLDVNAARLLDLPTARRLTAIPVSQNANGVRVAFADPFYEDALQEISFLLKQTIIPCLASREDIQEAIQRILGQMNLGTSLLLAGHITLSQLNNALALARNSNIRLGRALVHRGFISEKELYQFLAQQASLPLFDLSTAALSDEAAHLLDAEDERREGVLPLAVSDESIYLAMVDPLNEKGLQMVEQTIGKPVVKILVTENDFDLAMEKLYKEAYLDKSTSELLKRSPEDSAFHVFSRGQIVVLVILAILSIIWVAWNYLSYLVVLNSLISIFYLLFTSYKAKMIANAVNSNLEVDVTDEDVAALKDRDLPIYTILVPVYGEAGVLPKLLKRLGELDYPATKLDIKILMEVDDHETIDAFYLSNPPDFIHPVIIPDAQPKTKPKACNYGLIHARGEYLVIYDAEDLPELDQLKRVVAAFHKVPADVVCIQAKLNYYNRAQNILTQWFTSEYSMWFDLLLPGLDNAHAPIPLGGTSNHFKTLSLLEIGAWDPYNVTEDADLGMRLYKRGYRTRIVDSTTYEEANSRVGNWIRQRSRWVKGYIQTWLVHMRHPVRLFREIGFKAFFSFQMLIGGTFFSLLMNPIYWVMTTVWYLFQWNLIQSIYPESIFYIGALCLYIGNFVFTYANIAGAIRHKYYDLVRSALFSPIYWGLMSIGAWKGFFQLFSRPHFWEKTRHGLSELNYPDLQEQNDPVLEPPAE